MADEGSSGSGKNNSKNSKDGRSIRLNMTNINTFLTMMKIPGDSVKVIESFNPFLPKDREMKDESTHTFSGRSLQMAKRVVLIPAGDFKFPVGDPNQERKTKLLPEEDRDACAIDKKKKGY